MDLLDQMARRRAYMLNVAGISFGLWQSLSLLEDLWVKSEQLLTYVHWVGLGGAVIWVSALIILRSFDKKVSVLKAVETLEDELTQHNRMLACTYSFYFVFLAASLAFFVNMVAPSLAETSLRLLFITAVTVPAFAFAHLELKNL